LGICENCIVRTRPAERGQNRKASTTGSVTITIRGTVQGVGFRPFVYRLAREVGLAGSVRNAPGGVEIHAEGAAQALDAFVRRLREDAPPLARIRVMSVAEAGPVGAGEFHIESTGAAGGLDVDAARDVATCEACLAEMEDPANRRYRHPFINCTDCGPRYTIIEALPYDRPNTSMKRFPMCRACEREYRAPADRRFHAQPVSCWDCGPTLELRDAHGQPVDVADPITAVVGQLRQGRIAAVKGIGGCHLACDATSPEAVRRLRRRKHREEKPLAVMARDLDAARRIAHIGHAERALLEGPERPIVLLPKADDGLIAQAVDPRSRDHGVLLPYTPVHHLLMEELPYLVMTSGNRTEEPIARTNDEALTQLRGIADLFLLHDRPILTRNDDSVVRVAAGQAVLMRRSRGYAPEPVDAGQDVDGILACGPLLKNCVAVGRADRATVSQHIGDLTNHETYRSLEQTAARLCDMLGVEPTLAACDKHPGYASTRFAESLGLPIVRVQHHHAHVAACMAENGLHEPVIGIIFDGTGYGDDGRTWGSEVLLANRGGYRRFGHLAYMRMPGGDAAVEHPGRMALGALFTSLGRDAARAVPGMDPAETEAVFELLEQDVNAPLSCGMGRLFDAVSAALGVCTRATYEGQPAIELEGIADPAEAGVYPLEIEECDGQLVADGAGILRAVLKDRDGGTPAPVLAGRFHNTIVELLLEYVVAARERSGRTHVCLSGGCFQNALLLERSVRRLAEADFVVHRHRLVPPNDGCVALGQMIVAAETKG
jgi:hydrogenase maturation protein HypF